MQATNPGSGSNQGGNKSGGLSWSTPPAGAAAGATGGAKPTQSPLPTAKPGPVVVQASRTRTQLESSMTTRTIGIFIAGVIVGALIMWGWSAFAPSASLTPSDTKTGAVASNDSAIGNTGGAVIPSTPSVAVANTITVPSPQDAGMQVAVSEATVSQPTWLVVYELSGGKPIRALGATMFFPENNGKGGTISLARATSPGTSYFVGQSLDSGDHTFALHVNKEVLDASGAMAGATFKTN
ncbi:MAG: hypothetical protein G01um101456_416 [Parcubacteria group bacterium Gr01-1014_56]|nr:MAG: hypothetical protein G01um101456_416 [Parcubacteria group bacterium Gr01-1014_56]